MKRVCWAFAALAVLTVTAGCSPTYTGGTLEPYRTWIDKVGTSVQYREVGKIEFRRAGFDILGIPVLTPDIISTLERERQELGADAVTDVTITSEGIFIACILMFPTYKVEATGIRFEGGRPL